MIDEVVDTTFFRLLESVSVVEKYFPVQFYPDDSLLVLEVKNSRLPLANIITSGAEIPLSRPNIETILRSITGYTAGKKISWEESDRALLDKIDNHTRLGNAEVANKLKMGLLGVYGSLVPSVLERSLQLMMLLWTTGSISFQDPVTRLQVNISYPVSPGQIPATLTAGARWSQAATCVPLDNLETHARNYYDLLGFWPQAILISEKQMRELRAARSVKEARVREQGSDIVGTALDAVWLEDAVVVDHIKKRTNCTEVIKFDTEYTEQSEAQVDSRGRFLPLDTYQFVSPACGKRAYMPVENASGTRISAIATNTKSNDDIPYKEWSTVVGKSALFVPDPRIIASAKVN